MSWPEHMEKEWNDGFNAGMKWCKDLSEKPDGYEVNFWPDYPNGPYWNGFAEGTITGGGEYNVSWRSVMVTDTNWVVARDGKKYPNK